MRGDVFSSKVHLLTILVLAVISVSGCAMGLPRALSEALYGAYPTPTPRVRSAPTPRPSVEITLPTPMPTYTPRPTLTAIPTRTATATRTATPTPSLAALMLQQGGLIYDGKGFVAYEGTQDAYISDWNRDGNFAQAPVLSVRQGNIMVSLIRFDLSHLPPDLVIESAEMGLYVTGRSNETPMTMTIYAALTPWLPDEVTWLQASDDDLWEEPGASGETDRSAEPVGELVVGKTGVWLTYDLTTLVQTWLQTPKSNHGLIITGGANNAVQYDLASADSRDARRRPWLKLTFATGAVALGPPQMATPTPSATPTVDPWQPELVDVARLLPRGSTILARAAGELDGDEIPDITVAFRAPDDRGIQIAILRYYAVGGGAKNYRLVWNSQALTGTAPVGLDLVDLTGDGRPEILVGAASPGGQGSMLYVFTNRPLDYRLVAPVGGYFDGRSYFGESGYELADKDGDGQIDIVAHYGDEAAAYTWDGVNFVLLRRGAGGSGKE